MQKQILFTFFVLSLEFSITTIDFLFLEKVSYLAAIGVGAVISFVYMSQNIINLFNQSMIDNAIYLKTDKKDFSKILSAGLLYSIILSVAVALLFYSLKGFILGRVKISQEALHYSVIYITYILPFYICFNLQKYYSYIFYAMNSAKVNFLLMASILFWNFILDYASVNIFHFGVQGIALASALSLLFSMPFYIFLAKRHKIKLNIFTVTKEYLKKANIGLKNLGIASSVEPLMHQLVQFVIIIILAQLAQEMTSARIHTGNFLQFTLALSLAFGIMIQIQVAKFYSSYRFEYLKKFYQKYLILGVLYSIFLTLIAFVIIFTTIDFNWYSSNNDVKKYILVIMSFGLILEPLRAMSIISKAHLKGLQEANTPLVFMFISKLVFSIPLLYLSFKYTNWGLVGVLLIEGCGYLLNFVIYSWLLRRKYKQIMKNILVPEI